MKKFAFLVIALVVFAGFATNDCPYGQGNGACNTETGGPSGGPNQS